MKKISIMLSIMSIFLINIMGVDAKTLTLNELKEGFNKSQSANLLTLESKVENNKFNIYVNNKNVNNELIMSFNYQDNYLEYIDNDTKLTKDNIEEIGGDVFSKNLAFVVVFNTILDLSGYENMVLDDAKINIYNFGNSFDKYGLEIKSEHYEFTHDSENGYFHFSGEILRQIKLSLDTDKIKKLMDDYGKKAIDEEQELLKKIIPVLEAKDITASSVTIYPSINVENAIDEDIMCDIYRSTSKDGNYEKLNGSVNCMGGVGLTDENLKSNTTYYYKAAISNSTNYSNIIEVTTKKDSTVEVNVTVKDNINKTNKKNDVENPDTGMFIPCAIFMGLIILAIIIYLKKHHFVVKL